MNTPKPLPSRQGFSIIFVMAVLAAIAIVSSLVLGLTRANVKMSGYYRWEQGARYNALAGIEYVKARIEADFIAKTLELNTLNTPVNYQPPSGYDFDPVTNIVRLAGGDGLMFTSRGREVDSMVELEVVYKRRNLLSDIGLFGDELFNGQPNAEIYSYRSSRATLPLTAADSTGEAGVGSNEEFKMPAGGAVIDGTVFGGLDTAGVAPEPPGAGYVYEPLGERVEPDPLGIVGGSYAQYMDFYRQAGNNDNKQVPAIVNNQLAVDVKQVVQIPSGDYYLTDVDIKGTVEILGTKEDPVYFWLEGAMKIMPQADITTPGQSPVLRVFSNSTQPVDVQPTQPGNSHLLIWIYAPYAEVTLQPNNDTYGAAWGREMVLQPNNRYFIDVDLLDEYMSDRLELVSLKELRD